MEENITYNIIRERGEGGFIIKHIICKLRVEGGDSVEEHSCIPLNQQDSQFLEQLLYGHVLLLPRAPCLGPGDPLNLVLSLMIIISCLTLLLEPWMVLYLYQDHSLLLV